MEMPILFAKVATLIASQLEIPEGEVGLQDRLKEDLEADSLDRTELQMALEEHFDIVLPDEQWRLVRTVEEVVGLVDIRLQASRR